MKHYKSQWSAQFFVGAELIRRGYMASFTMGAAPEIDLMAVSPKGTHFAIDVKGLASKNFWLIRERAPRDSLFYILVHVAQPPAAPEFFIVSSADLMAEIAIAKSKILAANKPWLPSGSGISWKTSQQYKDKWSVLPQ